MQIPYPDFSDGHIIKHRLLDSSSNIYYEHLIKDDVGNFQLPQITDYTELYRILQTTGNETIYNNNTEIDQLQLERYAELPGRLAQ